MHSLLGRVPNGLVYIKLLPSYYKNRRNLVHLSCHQMLDDSLVEISSVMSRKVLKKEIMARTQGMWEAEEMRRQEAGKGHITTPIVCSLSFFLDPSQWYYIKNLIEVGMPETVIPFGFLLAFKSGMVWRSTSFGETPSLLFSSTEHPALGGRGLLSESQQVSGTLVTPARWSCIGRDPPIWQGAERALSPTCEISLE